MFSFESKYNKRYESHSHMTKPNKGNFIEQLVCFIFRSKGLIQVGWRLVYLYHLLCALQLENWEKKKQRMGGVPGTILVKDFCRKWHNVRQASNFRWKSQKDRKLSPSRLNVILEKDAIHLRTVNIIILISNALIIFWIDFAPKSQH